VHAIARNYRFVLMAADGALGARPSAALAERHLRWLLRQLVLPVGSAADLRQRLADYFDARAQLNQYFPLYDPASGAVDWWLRNAAADSARMQAVERLAPIALLVDWQQAEWAWNVFDLDWLWALHQPDNPYWQQNQRIVAHAWQRWQHGDGGEWLQIAVLRVHPHDALAAPIARAAEAQLVPLPSSETPEYRHWLFDLWRGSLRVALGRGDDAHALALVHDHADYIGPLDSDWMAGQHARREHAAVLERALRWLVYTNHLDSARALLALAVEQHPHSFRQWRVLLATRWDDAVAAAYTLPWRDDASVGNAPDIWQDMLNLLPGAALYTLAADVRLPLPQRRQLARSALTRSLLLPTPAAARQRDAVLASQLDLGERAAVLDAVAADDADDFIDFLLDAPRYRPAPYLEYAQSNEIDPQAIDPDNPNDDNWWCRYDAQRFEAKLAAAARIAPLASRISDKLFAHASGAADATPYIASQTTLLANHPFRRLIDPAELAALAQIPAAPTYLTQAALARERYTRWAFWRSAATRERHAARLHHAVRTTRYGCRRDGPQGRVSKAAFDVLHRDYADSVWTRATPYWFDLPGAQPAQAR
jgi:hypothetical protein